MEMFTTDKEFTDAFIRLITERESCIINNYQVRSKRCAFNALIKTSKHNIVIIAEDLSNTIQIESDYSLIYRLHQKCKEGCLVTIYHNPTNTPKSLFSILEKTEISLVPVLTGFNISECLMSDYSAFRMENSKNPGLFCGYDPIICDKFKKLTNDYDALYSKLEKLNGKNNFKISDAINLLQKLNPDDSVSFSEESFKKLLRIV